MALVGLAAFVKMVGPEASVLRAAVMGAIGLTALSGGRRGRSLGFLYLAISSLLILDPSLGMSVGFLLSVLATLGIVLLARPIASWAPAWLPSWIASAIAVPLSAQLLCSPVIVALQPQFSSYSLLTNVAAAPFVAPVTILGTIAVPFVPLVPWFAAIPMAIAGASAGIVAVIARFCAGLPGAALPWPEGLMGIATMLLWSVVTILLVWLVLHPAWTGHTVLALHRRLLLLMKAAESTVRRRWVKGHSGGSWTPGYRAGALANTARDAGRGRLGLKQKPFWKDATLAAAQVTKAKASAANTMGWRDVTPSAVVLITGPEEYLGIRAMDRIRSQVRATAPDVEISKLNAGSYESGSLAMTVTPSLFDEAKLIEIEGLESMNDAFLADALTYLAHPENDVVLVLRHGGGVRGKKLLDAIKSSGWPVVDCQPLKKDAEKTAFVVSEFKAGGRRIEAEAVQALVNAVGSSLSELAAACNQLIADATTAVDAATVERYYGGRVEATAFKVADAAMAGNGPQALSSLRHALATGVDPVPLVAALAAKLRTLAKVAGAQGSSAQIAKQLGMQPWLVEQAQRDVRRWTPEGLIRSIQVTAEADAQVKGLSRDPVYAVEHAVTVIAASARGR